ncbi:MAG: NAD(P)-binding domain-containing protein, partial [Acidimicrobiales bacterium]
AMAQARLGTLVGRQVVVLGAGEMGTGMAQALSGAGAEVTVVNRTRSRATALAQAVGGRVAALQGLPRALAAADVLLSSMQGPSFLFGAEELRPAMDARADRPLLVVDIALPRSVDPSVAAMTGVTLLDLDDIGRFAEEGRDGRRREASRVAEIVEAELGRYEERVAARGAAPLVSALRGRAEAVRRAELSRYRSRLGDLDERQAEAVEALTKGIVAKLLHAPTEALKEGAGSTRAERLAEAAAALFDL